MRIMSGCFSLLTLLIVLGVCLGIFMTPMANSASQRGGLQRQPGNAVRSGETVAPDLFRNISKGIFIVVGGTVAFGVLVCIGGPAALVTLGLALFFYSQYQKERRHREMLIAQYTHIQLPWNGPPGPPTRR